jgi:Na+/melibiose symporter-like transporter
MHWASNAFIEIIKPELDSFFITMFVLSILPTIFVIFAFKYIKKLRAKTEESTLSNHHSWRQTIDVVLGKIKDL